MYVGVIFLAACLVATVTGQGSGDFNDRDSNSDADSGWGQRRIDSMAGSGGMMGGMHGMMGSGRWAKWNRVKFIHPFVPWYTRCLS